jgi:hypothetical protein
VSLPEQIQQQVEQAQAIIEQHYGTGEEAASGAPGGNQEPETAEQPGGTSSTAAEPVTPAQAPAQQPAEDENSDTYAQRWRSLQGVYNRTAQEVSQYKQRVDQLEQLIANMAASQPAPVQQQPTMQQFVTEKDAETFGDDLIDVARRITRDEMAPLVGAVQALREEIGNLRGVVPVVNNVAAQARMSAEERFFNALAKVVPDWEQVNGDARFHQWLLTPDPLTGITRQTYLVDAQQQHNVPLVANIFNAWKEISGAAQVPQSAGPNRAKSELEKQVAPGRTLAAPAPQSQVNERTYTPADIQSFYDDVRKGVFKGRDAERAEIERDIFLAQREGRIQRAA